MARRVCEIPVEFVSGTFHSDSLEILVDGKPIVTAGRESIDEVTEQLLSKNFSKSVENSSKEIPSRRKLSDELEEKGITLQNSIIVAFMMDIHVHGLKKNWDLFILPTGAQSVKTIVNNAKNRIARIQPNDIASFLMTRAMSRETREKVLKSALDGAGDTWNPITGQLVKIDTGRAKTALGHEVVTDADGLALDFSPSFSTAENQASKILGEEVPSFDDLSDTVRNSLIRERADEMIVDMTQYLFRESADFATSVIKMTGTRYHDEIAAVRALIAKNNGVWEGLGENATNGQINTLIKDLKTRKYVFHHSGKVTLDADGYPMVEMQLVRTDAHHKMGTGYYEFPDHEIQNWLLQAGDPTRIHTAYENFLGHVGGCKVFTLFYGLTTSYF